MLAIFLGAVGKAIAIALEVTGRLLTARLSGALQSNLLINQLSLKLIPLMRCQAAHLTCMYLLMQDLVTFAYAIVSISVFHRWICHTCNPPYIPLTGLSSGSALTTAWVRGAEAHSNGRHMRARRQTPGSRGKEHASGGHHSTWSGWCSISR